jgi:hypothetical protein
MSVEDGFLLYIVLFSQITYKWQSSSNCHLSIISLLLAIHDQQTCA